MSVVFAALYWLVWLHLLSGPFHIIELQSLYCSPSQGGSASNLNMNLYATKKTAAEGMLDIALFLANITHMKTVIEQGAGYRYSLQTGLCMTTFSALLVTQLLIFGHQVLRCCPDTHFLLPGSSDCGWSPHYHHWWVLVKSTFRVF